MLASVKETPLRSYVVPLDWLVQLEPPSVVRRTVPSTPTTVPVFASVNERQWRSFVVPLGWFVQLEPPSFVRRIVPTPPTVVPVSVSVKETFVREFPWGIGDCQDHPDCART